jgi:alanyl-tRNA synthetase
MLTERLYYSDSHLIEFQARVVDVTDRVSGWTAVILDRTAFYPTGGGQPSDTGTLNGTRVEECIDDGERGVLHVIRGSLPTGTVVQGRVDWTRRLDHIQQHTGQHLLSQAFVTLFNAPTNSFRVLESSCEIDVDLPDPGNEKIERAVELANNVIWEDRPITIHNVTPEEAAAMQLRKGSSREGDLRLIEIEGFDLTPCGGTHAMRTGEVGMIGVKSWERAKGLTRIEFVAGRRMLVDYRLANKSARDTAAVFSAGREDGPQLAMQLLEESKELHKRLRVLEDVAAGVEAETLLREASVNGDGPRVVVKILENRDADSLRRLAHSLISNPATIVILGSSDKDTARLMFARSADAPGDMNQLMREACALLDGRGGGKPDLAQGGGKNVDKLADALEFVRSKIF